MSKRQWADQYGSQWYKHYDGKPPFDDDTTYVWTGNYWQVDWDYEKEMEDKY